MAKIIRDATGRIITLSQADLEELKAMGDELKGVTEYIFDERPPEKFLKLDNWAELDNLLTNPFWDRAEDHRMILTFNTDELHIVVQWCERHKIVGRIYEEQGR